MPRGSHRCGMQAALVAAEGPILTQKAYTTLVNRLALLLRRAEGNSRIPGKLKRRAKVQSVPGMNIRCIFDTPVVGKKRGVAGGWCQLFWPTDSFFFFPFSAALSGARQILA